MEIQRRELENMDPQRVQDKAVESAAEEPAFPPESIQLSPAAVNFLKVEGRFCELVVSCFSQSHRVLRNQRLGTAEYDLLLQPATNQPTDIVIEVKYIRHGFRYGWLRETVTRLALASEHYRNVLKRSSLALLVVIFAEDDAPSKSEYQQLRQRVRAELMEMGVVIRVEYVTESALDRLDCAELKRLVLG